MRRRYAAIVRRADGFLEQEVAAEDSGVLAKYLYFIL
jgi:hypothetical protein